MIRLILWTGVHACLRMPVRVAFGGGKMSANPDLFVRIKKGDEDAFVEFLSLYVQPRLFGLVKRRNPGLQAADLEDLQADWLCKALRWYCSEKSRLPKTATALAKYCLVMGNRQITDRGRRERRAPVLPDSIALERATGEAAPFCSTWDALMTQLRAIPRDGLSPRMVHAYDAVVDLIDNRMRWPSTREIADRMGVSLSRASRLKTRVQFWMRSHMALE